MDDRGNRQQDVGAVVDHSGGIAGANAQSGLAGGISCLHHAGAAGGEDQVGFRHHLIGQLQRGLVDPRDDAFRRTGGDRRFQHHPCGCDGAALRSRMGADDDAVTGLQGDQGLENSGRGGIGGGNHRGDDADGLGDPPDAVGCVLFDDAAGLGVPVGIIDVLGGKVVLDDLVLHYAHAGFLHGKLCQGNAHLVGGSGSGQENLIHLLLGVFGILLLGGTAPGKGICQFLRVGDGSVLFFHS